MAGRITVPPMSEEGNRTVLPLGYVTALLDTMEKPLIVVERSGNILMVNSRARQFLESRGYPAIQGMNLFSDLLHAEPRKIFDEIEKGEHEVHLQIQRGEAKSRVRVQWMPQPDWLVLEIENKSEAQPLADPATQLTVQDLLQERESVPGVSGPRVENATRGDQGILRSSSGRFAGSFDGQAAGHS